MRYSSESVEILLEQLTKLPSIGRKSAQRLVDHVLRMPRAEVEQLANALIAVTEQVKRCSICMNITDTVPCGLCRNTRRDQGLVCVVQEPSDIVAMERTGEYFGAYHVLGGVIFPSGGIHPEDLYVRQLVERVNPPEPAETPIREVILAVNPTVEGDMTALYIAQLLQPFEVRVTRLARGLPIGIDLTYADEATLSRAIAGRSPMNGPAPPGEESL